MRKTKYEGSPLNFIIFGQISEKAVVESNEVYALEDILEESY